MRTRLIVILIAVILSALLLYGTVEVVRQLVNDIYGGHPKKHNVTRIL
jgi:hypothetical protein